MISTVSYMANFF